MLNLMLAAAALAGLASAARADTPGACIALWDRLYKTNQTQGLSQQDFMAACLAHSTALARPNGATGLPQGATARCRDGAYTTAAIPLAGCSRHGGVAAVLPP